MKTVNCEFCGRDINIGDTHLRFKCRSCSKVNYLEPEVEVIEENPKEEVEEVVININDINSEEL